TESVVLSGVGATVGLFVGWLGLHAILLMRPSSLSELSAARLDATTLGLVVLVAAACGIAFGLVGAVHVGRHSTHEALKAGATNISRGGMAARLRAVLVVSEMALTAT